MPVLVPNSLREATELLAAHPDAHLLGGGTDLMVEVNFNHRRPTTVIALRKLAEIQEVEIRDSHVTIGSGVPYADMEKGPIATALPALAAAARTVGSPQIRSAGTLGGNLGTCSPAGDSLPVLFALDALVHLNSATGSRDVSIHDFMVGPKRNSRHSDEIITAVTIPTTTGWQGYSKVGVRNAMVISVASACLAIDGGKVRIALGSVGPTIIRCRDAESWLNGVADLSQPIPDAVATEFGKRVSSEARPITDHRSTADYRKHAVGVLATRLIQRGTAQ
jgi:CO/xanthine dehydrogenase FAD-binding subunit